MPNRREFLALIAAGLYASGSPGASFAETKSGKVVLYTSNNTEVVQIALNEVLRQAPGLNIRQVTGGTGVLMKRIEAEAANPAGDVFWSGGFGTLGAYVQFFDRYVSPEAKSIPSALLGPDGLWTGTNVHVMLVMANMSRVGKDSIPQTWTDLFDPRWKGRIAMTDPNNSSFTYVTVYGLLKKYGAEGLRKLAPNLVITGTTGETNTGVSGGEFALGITAEAAAYEYVAAGQSDISLVYPKDGAVLSPEGVVLVKGAKNPEAGRKLYDAFLSKGLQEAVLTTTFRRPSRSDIKVSSLVKLPDMNDVAVIEIDQIAASKEREFVLKAWNEAVAASGR
ncbi:extracellular solute-binding protein [Bradyrhizobium elkanii]